MTKVIKSKKEMTDEELLSLPDDGYKYEYVKGELRVSPAGLKHEDIGANLIRMLLNHVKVSQLGKVYGSSTGYRLPNGNLRSPDVSFVRRERLPGGESPEGFAHFAPNLAVEILSPSDRMDEINEKIAEYFDNGTILVWVIDPKNQTVTVYSSPTDAQVLQADAELTGEDVIPGFRCYVRDLFS
jgi:Uma2 family endonuclease